jgi:hypothetical protein
MAIGLYVAEDVRAYIGEIKEKLLFELDEQKVDYNVPFDKAEIGSARRTIITMRNPDTEMEADNDVIFSIKTENSEFSNLDKIENANVNIIEHLNKIKEKLSERVGAQDSIIKIEKIDTKTLNITAIIISGNTKVRIQIVRDTFGNIYINTITRI